ncbi:MAG: 23S rRNA (adenine(2030)-N(6))-methyltransferase RlmJ [Gammaproteobacteria bacterium]|nr:23S rRNA (adenine(2030)-N(6))-methyltransferase RlmJ [Gammaproteobacteria bacterium]MCP5318308.1 23S rRNA (adenine(2030)-N(6))-methyltransferase RlmJ [Chromatiaceae bacterium]MCW5587871.1 23S rRNA (adenine(2030)-N(6))-methyltransferase RlmJ [Chromatiales bacterium]MCB1818220.1 23S rRNA (adenine(2030)-N(6))-methyltransferase RlmJ [Gammaproteobacteria bacterium]MCP5434949.1 23S rRNA (adenine(2030)-N(6))-methyltransferase RlmJ [Chromatiaceae bacterium]
MLSYRHAFHAGNHADVLKHYVLFEILSYYGQKDKPYWYIDTHAGAGQYDLKGPQAAQNAEYLEGVGRLWEQSQLPPALVAFLGALRAFNSGPDLRIYPGSPLLAGSLVRDEDRMLLYEMHPADLRALQARFKASGRQVRVRGEDGFAGLVGILPPPTRRAVILIDPPYEVKADYRRVEEVLSAALKRFPQGTYVLWYPLLRRNEVQVMRERFRRLGAPAWLQVELQVRQPTGSGMYGSGVYVINPPWTLPQQLESILPTLRDRLAVDAGARFSLESHIP